MEKTNRAFLRKLKKADGFQKRSVPEKIIFGVVFVLFLAYAIVIAYPLVYLLIKSLQYTKDYIGATWKEGGMPPTFYFRSGLDFSNYLKAFTEMRQSTANGEVGLFGMLFNSIWYTATRIVLNVLMCAVTGYNLAKYKFPGSNLLYGIAIFSMTIPVIGTTGSLYKMASDLGIYNTPFYVILISLGGFGFNFLVMYGFFSNVSWSYAEAVFLDGGGHWTAFFKVMLPQATPSLVTLAILGFIGYWNDYNTMLLFLPSYPTLASGLYVLDLVMRDQRPIYFAGLVIMLIPVLTVFTVFSDVIMGNMTVGGLKG
ncbi:MAG: carbohydrate ABC transporter permease [Clostridia bacterium]|nr:carbohydrate ABC transporter permease [Clostridia bacterium]